MTRYRAIFAIGFALAAAVGALGYKIVRTAPAPIESDRKTWTRLAWIDRSGSLTDSIDLPGHYTAPRLSPDGRSAVLTRIEPGASEIYSLSFATRQLTPVSVNRPQPRFPVWSPDGRQFVYSSNGELIVQSRVLPARPFSRNVPEDWSSDGRWIAFTAQIGDKPNELYVIDPDTGSSAPLLKSQGEASEARFSPDGRQIAFVWNRNVYVAKFPLPTADPLRMSDQGGHSPAWGPNGELFYISAGGDLMASNRPLFRIAAVSRPEYQYRYGGYCVVKDGRLLFTFLKQP